MITASNNIVTATKWKVYKALIIIQNVITFICLLLVVIGFLNDDGKF